MHGTVEAVHRSASHTLKKPGQLSIRLLAGLGVEGDAHMGATVKHRSRVKRDPSQPNLRQVHLIHAELHDVAPLDLLLAGRDQQRCRHEEADQDSPHAPSPSPSTFGTLLNGSIAYPFTRRKPFTASKTPGATRAQQLQAPCVLAGGDAHQHLLDDAAVERVLSTSRSTSGG